MGVGTEKVVVVKLPGLLMAKPEGVSVIVEVEPWKPGALTVTVTVPVLSRAWSQMAGVLSAPWLTVNVSEPLALPATVALAEISSLDGSPLVTVIGSAFWGAGAPSDRPTETSRSLPMV